LKLEKERQNDVGVASTLEELSDANRSLGLHEEGIQQAKEALEFYERLGDKEGQIRRLNLLAFSLHFDKQFDAAEEAASRAIELLPEKVENSSSAVLIAFLATYHSTGKNEKAIHHYEAALGNRILFQLVQSAVLESFRPGGAVFR
jgi:tetratricopeptide (TPR) repeat protein